MVLLNYDAEPVLTVLSLLLPVGLLTRKIILQDSFDRVKTIVFRITCSRV